MDLHNGRITLRQILNNPRARALLTRELPQFANSPLLGMASGMTLNQLLNMAKGSIPKTKLDSLIQQLTAL